MFDIVGLGGCGIDQSAKVKSFSDKDNKVISDNITINEGGVTANNLIQAARLGLKTAWCGMLGEDEQGEYLIKKFEEDNVKVYVKKIDKTQFCWIIIDEQGEKQIYIFPNATKLLTPEIVEENFKDIIKQSRHFHTEAAVIPLAAAIKGAEIAKEAKSKVLVDIDGNPDHLINKAKIGTKEELMKLIELADVIKLSESAAKNIFKEKDINEIIKKLLENTEIVAVTLGKDGCYIADKDEIIKCPAYQVECLDSTGAGDSFMGGLSYGILKNMKLKEIGMFANACGAYCCTKIGTRSSGKLSDIKNFIK